MPSLRKPVAGSGLTAEEIHIVHGLASGKTNSQIGHELFITSGAVAQRIYRLSIAMGTRTTIQTVVECFRRGWVRPVPSSSEPTSEVSRAAVETRT